MNIERLKSLANKYIYVDLVLDGETEKIKMALPTPKHLPAILAYQKDVAQMAKEIENIDDEELKAIKFIEVLQKHYEPLSQVIKELLQKADQEVTDEIAEYLIYEGYIPLVDALLSNSQLGADSIPVDVKQKLDKLTTNKQAKS